MINQMKFFGAICFRLEMCFGQIVKLFQTLFFHFRMKVFRAEKCQKCGMVIHHVWSGALANINGIIFLNRYFSTATVNGLRSPSPLELYHCALIPKPHQKF